MRLVQVTSDLSQVFESVEKRIYWYLKVKEGKAFDYQIYPAIFIDLSIWQAFKTLGAKEVIQYMEFLWPFVKLKSMILMHSKN